MLSSCYIAFIISFLMSVESLSSPDMDNFDTRENFLNCTSPLMSEEYNDLSNCYTTWPIQFSLLITEKYCIKIREKIRQLSPMNIISCLNPNGTVLNCRNSKAFYNDTEKTLLTVNQTIE